MKIPFLLLIAFPLFLCDASLYNICSHDQHCGSFGHSIKYPFGLSHQGCGHPDFQIECIQNHAFLTINKQNYIVLNASYERQGLTVISEEVFQSSCGFPLATVNLSASPFHMPAGPYSNVTLLVNCVRSTPNFSRIGCSPNSYLGFVDPKVIDWYDRCESAVQVPVPDVPAPGRNVAEGYPSMLQRGFELSWSHDENIHESCSSCNLTNGVCGYNVEDPATPFLCYCRDGPHSKNCSDGPRNCVGGERGEGKSQLSVVIGVFIGCNVLIAAAALFAAALLKRKKRASDLITHPDDDFIFHHLEGVADDLISSRMCSSPIIFSYEELEESTNYFDEKRELGYGGFGTVYLGKLRDGGTMAVKKLHRNNSARAEQFANEVRILSSVRHSNLVRLCGYCPDRRNLLLVYEYVPNGTLAAHLHGEQKGKGLLWETRLNIALETAEALAFLHFCVVPPILHRDIKSSNILLDENFRAKVADFGLSRLLPSETTQVDTVPQGTPGYLDPHNDQYCYQLTDKGDVYSFGVVLVEIISAKNAVDITRNGEEISLAHLAISKIQSGALQELVDPHLEFESNPSVKAMVTRVAELAFLCLGLEKEDRPSMKEIVSQLQEIKRWGYGCPKDRQNRESLCKECKLATDVPPFSPTSVQVNWSSFDSASPENSS